MKAPLKVTIQTPCSEKWSEMVSINNDKFCKQCQKNVIDFTGKTDLEIYKLLSPNKGMMCGRFTTDQLNRKISVPTKAYFPANFKKLFAGILIASGSTTAIAMHKTEVVQTDVKNNSSFEHDNYEFSAADTSQKNSCKISGRIVDSIENPVYASIFIKEKHTGNLITRIQCNKNGVFEINLDSFQLPDSIICEIVRVNYIPMNIAINKNSLPLQLGFIKLKNEEQIFYGEIVRVQVKGFDLPNKKWYQFWKKKRKNVWVY